MENIFADRMKNVPKSFIREILKVTESPEIISFAGGLPNPRLFPAEQIKQASIRVIEKNGTEALQYSTTEGHKGLREYIADRYQKRYGYKVDPTEILITNGSQQAIDLMGKVIVNENDGVILERPGYLGAIQALSLYRPEFRPVPLENDGIDIKLFEEALKKPKTKMFYAVPSFHNPSGITYSAQKRERMAEMLLNRGVLLLEDDPYGEIRFIGEDIKPVKFLMGDMAVHLGSFSKIFAPAFRLGWIYAPKEIMKRINTAKQAADLHTNYFSQCLLYEYLTHNDLDAHIAGIKAAYRSQRGAMVAALEEKFGDAVSFTRPEGGLFLWMTLPDGLKAMDFINIALKHKVAFVPGNPFYVDGGGDNTLRLNYSSVDEETIRTGVGRLFEAYEETLASMSGH
jgi:2-aminoadipate transaminase